MSIAIADPQAIHLDNRNWLVNEAGDCLPLPTKALPTLEKSYRLYRFLTELEDILDGIPDDRDRLGEIVPRVRQLLESSYWLQMEYDAPSPVSGWSVRFLYQDQDFLLTLQMVAWLPGRVSPIHNHGTWGVVALVDGQEKNQFWRRSPTPTHPDRLALVGDRILSPGEIISFLPNAIHCVEPLGKEPAITFNLYGVTDFSQRFEFDPTTHTASNF